MTNRMDAVYALVSDPQTREDKSNWRHIFEDPELGPKTNSAEFRKDMLKFLKAEAKETVKQRDAARRTVSPSDMSPEYRRITPAVGRYIFAVFRWHHAGAFPHQKTELKTIAHALNFRLDPDEIKMRDMSEQERVQALREKFAENDESESRTFFMISLFMVAAAFVFVMTKIVRIMS